MEEKVLTAPLAVIKVNGKAIGKMKNIRVTETIQRGRVVGIGKLNPSEIPATSWNGSLSAGFYSINFNNQDELTRRSVIRNVNNLEEWANTVLLQDEGVQVDILKKIKDTEDPDTGVITPEYKVFATVRGAFATKEGFDISEGQISGKDADFEYINPILFPN